MDAETQELWRKIKQARECLELVQKGRIVLAGALTGTTGMLTNEFRYPQPDIAEVYLCMFGRKPASPNAIYHLRFSEPMVWAGVSHVSGLRPVDIEVRIEGES